MGTNTKGTAKSTREALDALRRITQALREASRDAERELGISGAQVFVLQKLAEVPSQSLNELAVRTCTHQSSVSVVIGRLVDRGLVTRRRAVGDQRRLELVLTPDGRRLAKRTPDAVQARLIHAIDALPARSRDQLALLLKTVVAGINATGRKARMFFDDERKAGKVD
jgi:DNA-binding MarR family transcriptional regulator